MKAETLTRADLCEAVHHEVGLTRQDCAGLVERTLDLISEALGRLSVYLCLGTLNWSA